MKDVSQGVTTLAKHKIFPETTTPEEKEGVPEKQTKTVDPGESDDEETIREPSKREIEESYKPENVIAVQTVRDKKRKIHKQIVEKKREVEGVKDVDAIRTYLTKWKEDRDSWKFEKRKQVFIQNNCFDPSKVLEENWSECLEYLEGTKGKGRETLLATAEKIISDLDKVENKDETAKIKYNRSRDLLQMLN